MKEYIDENELDKFELGDDWTVVEDKDVEEVKEDLKKLYGDYKYSPDPYIEEFLIEHEKENKAAYKQYIAEHHKEPDHFKEGFKEHKDMATKALAAQVLLDSPKTYEFSPKLITFVAKRLDKALDLKNVHQDVMREACRSHKAAKEMMNDQLVKLYDVQNPAEYIGKMKKLYLNMMSKTDRSEKFRDFHDSVRKIATLKPDDKHLRSKLMLYNFDLMRNTEGYMKGKKGVRVRNDGKERFDNSLDALAIMDEYLPNTKGMINEIVDRTNEVRKAKPGDKDFVDLKEYGADRAAEASEIRRQKEIAKAKTNDKKLEKKMDNKYKAPGLV